MSILIQITKIIGPYRNAYKAISDSKLAEFLNLEEEYVVARLELENNIKIHTSKAGDGIANWVKTISVEFESEQAYAMFLLRWSYA